LQEKAAQTHRELQQAIAERQSLQSSQQQLRAQVAALERERGREFHLVKERVCALVLSEFETLQVSMQVPARSEEKGKMDG
jgi:prefoldin subunit 5